jgi:hypothetical protein
MSTPPLLAGAIHLSDIKPLPALAARFLGALGRPPSRGVAVIVTVDLAECAGAELSVTTRVAV